MISRSSDPFAESFRKAGVSRTVAMIVPSYTAAAAVVGQSDLVTILTASFLDAIGRDRDRRQIDTPFFHHSVDIAMCWHQRTQLDPANRAFRALIKAVVGSSPPTTRGSLSRSARLFST